MALRREAASPAPNPQSSKVRHEPRATSGGADVRVGDRRRSGPSVAEPRTATPEVASASVDDAPAPRTDWRWYAAVAVLALAAGISVAFAMSFYRQAGTAAAQASQAQQHAEQIATAADQRIEAARKDAATSIAQARETASKAQVISDVLAAPDLVRFNLVGGEGANRSSAQLLWSRSRGMVFSGSRLPPPPAGSMYQIWLLSADSAVSGGTFEPDASGRATSATDTPPNAPRPLTGVRVTLEPAPGRPEPSGAIVLARAQ